MWKRVAMLAKTKQIETLPHARKLRNIDDNSIGVVERHAYTEKDDRNNMS